MSNVNVEKINQIAVGREEESNILLLRLNVSLILLILDNRIINIPLV